MRAAALPDCSHRFSTPQIPETIRCGPRGRAIPPPRSASHLWCPESAGNLSLPAHSPNRANALPNFSHRFGTPQISEQQPFNLPNPESAGKIIYRSSLLKTASAGSVAASGLVSFRKNFLPKKFSYPKFRGSGPRSSTRSIPSFCTGEGRMRGAQVK